MEELEHPEPMNIIEAKAQIIRQARMIRALESRLAELAQAGAAPIPDATAVLSDARTKQLDILCRALIDLSAQGPMERDSYTSDLLRQELKNLMNPTTIPGANPEDNSGRHTTPAQKAPGISPSPSTPGTP